MSEPATASFAWKAESHEGKSLSGTIDSPDPLAAGQQLERLGLRVLEVAPAVPRPRAGKPLSSDDFHAFNLQLAQLTAAGLPLEQGLRLVARDLRRGRLARVVNEIADDLEKGIPLAEAFDRRRGRFPLLYGRLLDAGVRMGNLPGILLSLGDHLQLVQRLRAVLWNVLSYPATVLVALGVVLMLIRGFVQPLMTELTTGFRVELPLFTVLAGEIARLMPWLLAAVAALLLIFGIVALVFRSQGKAQTFTDYFVLPIPLVGPIVHRSLLSRWCHAVALGVEGGQDLPAAITLATDAIGSPKIARDSATLSAALSHGTSLEQVTGLRTLPATIPAAMQLGSATSSLASVMRNLSSMYQRQAEYRAQALPAILTPILLLVMGVFILVSVLGLFLPLISLLNAIS